jgi:hypothetical protein
MPRYRETGDDHALRYLERVNRLRAGATPADMRKRANLTLVFSIKTEKRFVNVPQGLRVKRPFSNLGMDVIKVLWWRPLGKITYIEARRQTIKYLNMIGRLLIDRGEPIVAIRAHLVDWSTEKPVLRRVLRDLWWYDKTFSGWIINAARLRSWGMAVDDGFEPKYDPSATRKPSVQHDDISTLDGAVSFNINMVLDQAVNNIINEIPNQMRAKSVMQPHSTRFGPLAIQRVIITLRSQTFRKRMRSYLDSLYQSDEDFAAKLRKQSARLSLRVVAERWARDEVNERILPPDRN